MAVGREGKVKEREVVLRETEKEGLKENRNNDYLEIMH